MTLILHHSEFITSAPGMAQLPPEEPGLQELTLVGRSNVGKSSLLNRLFERKNLAKTSNTPGKTRLMNVYEVEFSLTQPLPKAQESAPTPTVEGERSRHRWRFIDLPGYGYAKVSKTEQAQWRKQFEPFLKKRGSLRAVMQLLDARHGLKENDLQMYAWLQHHGIDPLLVLTKTDKLSKNEQAQVKQACSKQLLVDPYFILLFSAPSAQGRELVWERLQQYCS